jgi:hypothetical protein
MSSPGRFFRRVRRCRKCGRITAAFVRAPEREFGYALVQDAVRKPCAFEYWQERRQWPKTRWAFRDADRRIAARWRAGRYAERLVAKRGAEKAAREKAAQGVLL